MCAHAAAIRSRSARRVLILGFSLEAVRNGILDWQTRTTQIRGHRTKERKEQNPNLLLPRFPSDTFGMKISRNPTKPVSSTNLNSVGIFNCRYWLSAPVGLQHTPSNSGQFHGWSQLSQPCTFGQWQVYPGNLRPATTGFGTKFVPALGVIRQGGRVS